ncbi:MAG TPA: bifunctional diaminohydroxyphosphoribosylaminopyrimidine deaminase/5-amino-6-(5-phosphoribosylamino)uracil reductase RibD [Chloroflexota bacterium]|nr:bifunctional diaminohydroxyphosphoribosylaminopyrimidine deaminase/5-amino-6-(5-phosphoribosylamino)uracil reductase RibD [Chloroflexota bacterium]
MARALELARAVKGRTSPNPAVGAVLVRDGVVVGEGATLPYGQPHAEPVALRAAGERARGATLYVTLEPCSHWGRTPPCAGAIVEAGVAEVHLATLDPNPEVAGRGRAWLEGAGVRTTVGDGLREARALNADFARWIVSRRPFVLAKFATSLDGRIATRSGDSRWITGPPAREEGHRLRDRADAILVGVGTVLADDPQLTTRLPVPDPQHPWRLVLDSTGRTPLTARLLGGELPGRTAICTTEQSPPAWRAAVEERGAEVLVLPQREGKVDLEALLDELGRRRVTSLLVEGGARVHGAFFDAGLVDRVVAFVAPLLIGGREAPGPVGGQGPARLSEARPLLQREVRQVGVDTLIAGNLRRVEWPGAPGGER